MRKSVQIRDVPDTVVRTLKVRAAGEGKSLSSYLLIHLKRLAATPTADEMWERIRRRTPVRGDIDVVALIREDRDRR